MNVEEKVFLFDHLYKLVNLFPLYSCYPNQSDVSTPLASVTDVVWEGDEPESKSEDNSVKEEGNDAVNISTDRLLVARKSPAVGGNAPANQAGKGGNKKAANKDPKKGNILSFFKKARGNNSILLKSQADFAKLSYSCILSSLVIYRRSLL